MFNDSNSFVNPESYINGFSFMSTDALVAFSNSNNLSLSTEELIFIRDYFRNEKKSFPTYNQIMFFDAISKIRRAQKKNYSIYSASAKEGAQDIVATSKDLLSKRNVINKKSFGAMPLNFASEIASEYLKHIGCSESSKGFTPSHKALSNEYYIHTDDDIPLFSYSASIVDNSAGQASQASNTSHNTFAMIYSTEDIGYTEYSARVNGFLSLPEISGMISNRTTVNAPFGLFDILIKETEGLFVNLSDIPEIEKDEYGKVKYLTSLLSSCIGKQAFCTNYSSIGIINRIAENYSLKVCIFATRNFSHLISLESIKNPTFSLDISFLQKLLSFSEHREYIFTDESNASLGARKNIYLTDNRSSIRQTYRAERILNFGRVIACASARELDSAPLKTSALAIIDVINSLVAKGVSKNAITLHIHYSMLSGTDNSEELGKNLSAILGAYRSMIELCVSDTEPQIIYNESKRSIAVLGVAKTPKRTINSSLSNGNTYLYFYNMEYSVGGLVNYEKYRKFIKYFYSLIEKDIITSALSINENLSTVIKSTSQDTELQFDEAFDGNTFKNSHGILFETNKMIDINDDIFYIGNTVEK